MPVVGRFFDAAARLASRAATAFLARVLRSAFVILEAEIFPPLEQIWLKYSVMLLSVTWVILAGLFKNYKRTIDI